MIVKQGKAFEKKVEVINTLDGYIIVSEIDENTILLNPENLKEGERVTYEI